MSDSIKFYVNGVYKEVGGEAVFAPLSKYLRNELLLKGTKEYCCEGDCGACTVLIGKQKNGTVEYETINSCITYLYQLNACHIVTIEGLTIENNLNPVQQSMVENHGSQCGFCTPGMVVSLYSMFDSCCKDKSIEKNDVKSSITGNLCRCTGYMSQLRAVKNYLAYKKED